MYPFVRGDCFLPSESIARVAAVIRNPTFRHEWDADFDSATPLRIYEQGQSILIYTSQKAKFPASARDLIIAMKFVKKDDGSMDILGGSVVDTDAHARSVSATGKVRATALSANWRLVQNEKGVQLTYIAHANPGGTLPSSMFRMVLSGLANCVSGVAKHMQRKGSCPGQLFDQDFPLSKDWELSGGVFMQDRFEVKMDLDLGKCPGSTERGVIWFSLPMAFKEKCTLNVNGHPAGATVLAFQDNSASARSAKACLRGMVAVKVYLQLISASVHHSETVKLTISGRIGSSNCMNGARF